MLIDLLIDGTSVIGRERSIDRDVLCDRLLGWMPSTNIYKGDYIKLIWMDISFKTPPTDAIDDQNIMCTQTYILHIFGGHIFISIAGNATPLFFLTLLEDFEVIPNYNYRGHACISLLAII